MKIQTAIAIILLVIITLINSSCKKEDKTSSAKISNVTTSLPTLNTTASSLITSSTAISGGNITSDGGASITQRGVCWSTSSNPSLSDSYTLDGTGSGIFTSSIAGLTANATYYVRAYAINSSGTAYGNEITFLANSSIAIGNSYQGGIIAYIFQPGDPGYTASTPHGLIAAVNDQSAGIKWDNGSNIAISTTGSALGAGNVSTNQIVASQGNASYAAKLCYDLVSGGYSDWYLPNAIELNKLYINRDAIGGFANWTYWSSLEYTYEAAFAQNFSLSTQYQAGKHYTWRVRAIRSF
jgi:hypothetical protein